MTTPPPGPMEPNFATWTYENLARFAADAHRRMKEDAAKIEALQLENNNLKKQLATATDKDDWK